ncbi:hypothetical protein ACTRV7_05110 [Staphylococcus xylosus]|uniref:hypothetical protein n=1 Tax=Staphylococcus xylosus TaxID=1288 RepID=UPI003F9ADE96
MALGTIGGVLAGGLGVAIFNQIAQWGRDTAQKKAENRSLIMREKLKIIYELNSEFRDFDNLTHSTYFIISKYMKSPLENRDIEINKLQEIDNEINKTQISNDYYLKNLYLNLSYFPELEKQVRETNIYNLQRIVVMGYLSIDSIENSYSLNRTNGHKREDIEKQYEENYREYVQAYQKITDTMKVEIKNIIKYLE